MKQKDTQISQTAILMLLCLYSRISGCRKLRQVIQLMASQPAVHTDLTKCHTVFILNGSYMGLSLLQKDQASQMINICHPEPPNPLSPPLPTMG